MNSRSPYETVHSHFSSWAFLPKEPVVALVSLLTFRPSGSHWPIVTRLSWKTTESSNACVAGNPFVSFADAPGQPWRTALASLRVVNNQEEGGVVWSQSVLYLTTDISVRRTDLYGLSYRRGGINLPGPISLVSRICAK